MGIRRFFDLAENELFLPGHSGLFGRVEKCFYKQASYGPGSSLVAGGDTLLSLMRLATLCKLALIHNQSSARRLLQNHPDARYSLCSETRLDEVWEG